MPNEPAAGQVRRNVMLGTEAVYRVCSIRGDLVDVEVIRAPGLSAGQRFALTRNAVGAMEVVSNGDSPG